MTKKTHKLFWILLMIIILVSSAFVYFDDYRTETVEAPQSSNTTQPLQEGQLLTQTLHCEGDGLNSIQIPFSTGDRVNHCMIYADLIVDGECAQSWELPAWKLKDGGSDKCRLSCKLAMHHWITVSHTEDPSVREECPRPDSADAHEPAGIGLPGTGRPGHCSVSLSHRLYALPKRPPAAANVTSPGWNSLCNSPVDQHVQNRLPPLLSFPAADSF